MSDEIDWKAHARKWEDRAKQLDKEADELATDVETWKRKARENKNSSHTWRLLYKDLLEKVGQKLNLIGELPHDRNN